MGVAVGGAVTHGVAGQNAAVAVAVGVDEAAAGDGENAIVVFSDGADVFTGDAQLAGGIYAQPAGILGNGQHAQVARAGDAHQQHLIFGVDGQHLLAVDGLNGGAAVIQTGLVDVEVVPAVGERLWMLGEICLQGRLVDLIEELVEVLLSHLLWIHFGDDFHIGDNFVGEGGFVFGLLVFLFLCPAGGETYLLLQCLTALIHHVLDDVRGDDGGGQPLVAQGIHGSFNVDGAPLGNEAVVGVDADKVDNFNQQQNAQHDGQGLERIAATRLRRLCRNGAAGGGSGLDKGRLAVLGQTGTGSRATK